MAMCWGLPELLVLSGVRKHLDLLPPLCPHWLPSWGTYGPRNTRPQLSKPGTHQLLLPDSERPHTELGWSSWPCGHICQSSWDSGLGQEAHRAARETLMARVGLGGRAGWA